MRPQRVRDLFHHIRMQPAPILKKMESKTMKIAFVQLASFGDCINSTLMFEPIKKAWPGCVLDVHTTITYGSAYDNNPFIDNLIKHPCASKDQAFSLYDVIPHRLSGYDKILVPAPILRPGRRNSLKHPEYGQNLWCTFLRALEDEGVDYPMPPVTVLRLTQEEVSRARAISGLGDGQRCILMETEGLSGQTYWNDNWTDKTCQYILSQPNTCLFISKKSITPTIEKHRDNAHKIGSHVVFVGSLTLRECAELYNHCHAFLSVSSGLCNACSTDWCKKGTLWVEAVNSDTVSSAIFCTKNKHVFLENNSDNYINLLKHVGL